MMFCRFRSRIVATALAAPWTFAFLSPYCSAQVFVAQHVGDTDPTTEDWTLVTGSNFNGGLVGIDDNGTLAWQLLEVHGGNNNFAEYRQEHSDALISDANIYGWSLTSRLRLPDFTTSNNTSQNINRTGFPQLAFIDATTSRIWFVGFGLSDFTEGDTIVQTVTSATTTSTSGPTYTLPGNSVYFDVELRFDPAAGTADLFIDDTEVISDYASYSPPQLADTSSVRWGEAIFLDVGVANYNEVSFQIHTAPAVPNIMPNPITLGEFHVGQTAEQALSIGNDVMVGTYSEDLRADVSSTGDVSIGGPMNNIRVVPGGTNTSRTIQIDATTAGAKSGNALLALSSSIPASAGTPARSGDLDLGTTNIPVTATVYRLAEPMVVTAQPVDFGIVHVGDSPTQALMIQNGAATDGFSENLDANFGTVDAGITTSGSPIDNLAPAATDSTSLVVGVDTSAAGQVNGAVEIVFTSDGAGVNSLGHTALSGQSVSVTAVVNEFANAEFTEVGGDAMLTKQDETTYTLDLGEVDFSATQLSATLELANLVAAPADDLAGDWSLAADDFELAGFAAFADLAAGNALTDLTVDLMTDVVGDFMGTITLSPRSENASGFSSAQDDITINLLASVVLPGDFDFDGDVDGQDFLMWQRGGSPNAGSAGDLTDWQTNYGTVVASKAAASTVPEPNGIALATMSLLALYQYNREFANRS